MGLWSNAYYKGLWSNAYYKGLWSWNLRIRGHKHNSCNGQAKRSVCYYEKARTLETSVCSYKNTCSKETLILTK